MTQLFITALKDGQVIEPNSKVLEKKTIEDILWMLPQLQNGIANTNTNIFLVLMNFDCKYISNGDKDRLIQFRLNYFFKYFIYSLSSTP